VPRRPIVKELVDLGSQIITPRPQAALPNRQFRRFGRKIEELEFELPPEPLFEAGQAVEDRVQSDFDFLFTGLPNTDQMGLKCVDRQRQSFSSSIRSQSRAVRRIARQPGPAREISNRFDPSDTPISDRDRRPLVDNRRSKLVRNRSVNDDNNLSRRQPSAKTAERRAALGKESVRSIAKPAQDRMSVPKILNRWPPEVAFVTSRRRAGGVPGMRAASEVQVLRGRDGGNRELKATARTIRRGRAGAGRRAIFPSR
jgi:hypothetical protein